MKKLALALIFILCFSVAFAKYTAPYDNRDLNTNRFLVEEVTGVTPTAFGKDPFELVSINNVFSTQKNITFLSDGNISITPTPNDSSITLGLNPDINFNIINIQDLNVISDANFESIGVSMGAYFNWINATGNITTTGTINSKDITIFDVTPILVFRDSDSLGAASVGFIEWRDSGGGRAGFLGNNSSGNDDLFWKNEQGGNIGIQTTGTGQLKVYADINAQDNDITTTGDAIANSFRADAHEQTITASEQTITQTGQNTVVLTMPSIVFLEVGSINPVFNDGTQIGQVMVVRVDDFGLFDVSSLTIKDDAVNGKVNLQGDKLFFSPNFDGETEDVLIVYWDGSLWQEVYRNLGFNNIFSGLSSGWGKGNEFSGEQSGWGLNNVFSGDKSGWGEDNTFSGERAGWGINNDFSGQASGWGSSNEFSGFASGWGSINVFSGVSAGWGINNIATYAQASFGRFSTDQGSLTAWVATDDLFKIGIGTGTGARADAFRLLKNGESHWETDSKHFFGLGNDVSMQFDSANWVFNAEVGSPDINFNGFGIANFEDSNIQTNGIITGTPVFAEMSSSDAGLVKAFTYEVTDGTVTSEPDVNSMKFADGNFFVVNESGSFKIDLNFFSVTGLPEIIIFEGRYEGNPAHEVEVKIFNHDTTSYDDVLVTTKDIPSGSTNVLLFFEVPHPVTPYVSDGKSTVRIEHVSGATGSHNIYIDVLELIQSTTELQNIGEYMDINGFQRSKSSGDITVNATTGEITIGVEGFHEVTFVASFAGEIGTIFESALFVNEIEMDECEFVRRIDDTEIGDIGSASFHCFIDSNVGDIFKVKVKDFTADSFMALNTGNFSVKRLN